MKCNYCEKEHDSDYICDEMFDSHAKSVLSLTTAADQPRVIEELTAELKKLREFVGAITSFHANEFGGKEMGDNVFIIVDGYGNELTTGTDPFDAWRKMNAGEGE